MNGQELYYRDLRATFDLVDYWCGMNVGKNVFLLYQRPDWPLDEVELVRVLYVLEELFPQYFKIEKAVDFHEIAGPGYHLLTPHIPGDDRPLAFAKIKLYGSFDDFRNEMDDLNPSNPVTSLEGKIVRFDDKTKILTVGKKLIPFEYASKQADVLTSIFKRKIGIPVEFEEIHEEVSAGDPYNHLKDDKSIRDCVNLINRKIHVLFNTKDKLLDHKNKGLFRNY